MRGWFCVHDNEQNDPVLKGFQMKGPALGKVLRHNGATRKNQLTPPVSSCIITAVMFMMANMATCKLVRSLFLRGMVINMEILSNGC